jgi:putative phosphoesterase
MQLRRIGIIGDVHAESTRLEAALRFLHAAQVERILCVGDIVDGPGSVDRCCELLQQAQVAVVRGNHDRWFAQGTMRDLPRATQPADISEASRTFINSLPSTQAFETAAGRLLLCHGMGDQDMLSITPDTYSQALLFKDRVHQLLRSHEFSFVINGHSHRRMVGRFDHLTLINAGALYDAHHHGDVPCIALADFKAGHVQFYEFQDGMLAGSGDPVEFAGA